MFGWFKKDFDWEQNEKEYEERLLNLVKSYEKRMRENEEKLIERTKNGKMVKTDSIIHALIVDLMVKRGGEEDEKIRIVRHSLKSPEVFFIVEQWSSLWSESLTKGYPSRTHQNVPITVNLGEVLHQVDKGNLEVLNMIAVED